MSNELHTMPLKCERLLSSRRYRTMEWDERGVYLQLLAEAWLDGCKLPNDSDTLQRLIGVKHAATWGRMWRNVVQEMFTASEDGTGLYNETQAEIWSETQAKHERKVKAGQTGGFAKSANAKHKKPSNARSLLQQEASNQNQSQSQSQNQSGASASPVSPSEDSHAQPAVHPPKTAEVTHGDTPVMPPGYADPSSFKPPTVEQCQMEAQTCGGSAAQGEEFYKYWSKCSWLDRDRKNIFHNWRAKLMTRIQQDKASAAGKSSGLAIGQIHHESTPLVLNRG